MMTTDQGWRPPTASLEIDRLQRLVAFWMNSQQDALAERNAWADRAEAAEKELARRDALATPSQPSCVQDARDGEIEFLEHWLRYAAEPTGQECCGRGYAECCGDPDLVYVTLAEMTAAMSKRHAELFAALNGPAPEIDDDPHAGGGYQYYADRATALAAITAKPGKGETK